MKRNLINTAFKLLLCAVIIIAVNAGVFAQDRTALIIETVKNISWFDAKKVKFSSVVRIQSDKQVIVIDPIDVTEENAKIKADIILITHEHFDHFDLNSVLLLSKKSTVVIYCRQNRDIEQMIKLSSNKGKFTPKTISYNEKMDIKGAVIEAVPAYDEGPHAKSFFGMGFIITLKNGVRLYASGDTKFIEEMKLIKDIDIAVLFVGISGLLTGDIAINVVNTIKPKIVIPVHWRQDYEKSEVDYMEKNMPEGSKLIILDRK